MAAITHFYSMNDIVVNCTKISKFISIDQRKKTKSNQGYTTEQIQQLLDVCDERTRAIILLYASSGIRLAALPSLRYGDLKPVKIEGGSIYEITVYQGYMEEYVTFCTPECAKVINSYLDYRTRSGETLRADSPLIREQFNASNSFRVKYPKTIATPTISKIIEQKMTQAGIRRVDHVGI